jgi:hypothetical protein
MRHYPAKLAMLAGVCFGCAAIVAILLSSGAAVAGSHGRTSSQRVSPALKRTLAVLGAGKRRSVHAQAADSNGVVESVVTSRLLARLADSDDPTNQAMGLNTAQTVEVDAPSSPSPVWVVPGSAGACVIAQKQRRGVEPGGAGESCTDIATIQAQGEITIGLEPDGSHLVYGMVPNGNADVTLTEPSGAQVVLPVTDNTISGIVSAIPATISLKSLSGSAAVLHP